MKIVVARKLLGTVDAPGELMFPMDTQVTCSKVKVKLLVFQKMLSAQYPDPFSAKFPNFLQWMLLDIDMITINVEIAWSKVKVKMRVFILTVVYSKIYDPYLIFDQTCYTGWLEIEDYPYCFSGSQCQGQSTGIDFTFVRLIFNEPFAW